MARVPARRKRRAKASGDQSDLTGVARAIEYSDAVIAGVIPACKLVIMACLRFRNDLLAADSGVSRWEFIHGKAEAKIWLAEQLPNIKGPLAGKPLVLGGWQCFIYANLFGFYERDTNARRFRQGVIYVPRGNGKTTFSAPLALSMVFCEEEGGAEGYAAAVTRDQARILFDTASQMVRRSPEFRDARGVEVSANSIYQETSASSFKPVSSDAKALDGLNVHVAVLD